MIAQYRAIICLNSNGREGKQEEKKKKRGRDGEKHIHYKEKLTSLNVPRQCPLVLTEAG